MSQSRGRTSLLLASAAAGALLATGAAAQTSGPALPTGGVVAASTPDGQGASISTSGPVLTVDQSSRRVIIDWASFNIGQGGTVQFNQGAANFIAFNRINPQAGLTSINGALNANGSVWLFAPGGLLFGPNANVNVGSLFAATATLRNNNNSALTSNTIGYDGTAGERPSIVVDAGARIQSNAGLIGMHSESLTLAGAMTASSDIRLQVSPSGQIAITDTTAGIDYGGSSGLGEVPGDPRQVSFSHTGESVAGRSFGVFAASGGSLNYQGVINLGGVVEADSISVLAGLGTTSGALLTLDTSQGSLTARSRVQLEASALRLGRIDAGELSATATNDVAVLGEIAATGNSALYSFRGDVTVGEGLTVRADSDGDGAGSLVIQAGRNVSAGAGSLLTAGPLESGPTGSVSVTSGRQPFGTANLGGDITVAAVAGRSVTLSAQSGSVGVGTLTVNGSVFGGDSVQLNSFSPTAIRGGDIRILSGGGVSSNGAVTINNFNGGNILIGSNVTVQSDRDGNGQGALTLQAQRSITADATSRLLAGSGIGAPTAAVNLQAGFTVPDGGNITTGRVSGRTVSIQANAGTGGNGQVRVLGDVLGVDSVNIRNGRTGSGATTSGALVQIDANVTSNGNIDVFSERAVVVGANRILRSDADGNGVGALRLDANTDITTGAGSLLVAGPAQGNPTAAVQLDAGLIRLTNPDGTLTDAIGGDTILRGSIRGRTVDVFGNSSPTAGGAMLLEGDIFATGLIRFGNNAGGPGRRGAAVTINGSITSDGEINVYNVDGGNTVLGAAARVQGDANGDGVGGVSIGAQRDVLAAAGSLVLGGASATAPTGFVNITAGTAGNAQNPARLGGDLSLSGLIAGSRVNMSALSAPGNAADILLAGTVFGRDSVLARTSAPLQNDSRQGGGVRVTGRLTSNGRVDVQSYDGGDLEIASTAVLRGDADGDLTTGTGLFLEANRNVSVLQGSLLATGLANGPGTGGVSLFAGYKPSDTATYGGDMTLAGTIISGAFGAGTSKSATRGGVLTISGDITASGRMDIDNISPDRIPGGVLNVTGRLRANGRMEVLSSGDLLVGPGASIQSDMDGSGDGDMFLYAVRDVTAGAGSTVLAGAAADRLTAIVTLESGTNNVTGSPQVPTTGGALSAGGSISGRVVNLQANSGGSVTVAGPVFGAESVRVRTAALGDLRGGTVAINGAVGSNGAVRLENLAGGDITIGAVTVRSDADGVGGGDLTVDADRDVTAAAGSLLAAGPAGAAPTGTLTVSAGDETGPADGGDITLGGVEARSISIAAFGGGAATGTINLLAGLRAQGDLAFRGDGALALGSVDILGNLLVAMGGDVTVGGPVSAGGSIDLQSTGVGGDLRIDGGLRAGRSLTLRTTDGDIAIGAVEIRAGTAGAGQEGGFGLTVDAGRNLLAAAGSLLSAEGGEGGAGFVNLNSGSARTRGGLGGDLRLGRVSGGDVTLQSYGSADGSGGDIVLAGAVTARDLYVGSGSYGFDNSAGDIRVLAPLTATEEITLINFGAADLIVGPGAVVRADSDGTDDGSISVDIDGSITADRTSLMAVGAAGAAPTGSIFMVARGNFGQEGGYAGNGDITLGGLSAGDIALESYGDAQGRGLITLAGEVVASSSLLVEAGSDSTATSGLRVLASVRSGGAVALEAAGDVAFGEGVTVQSGTDGETGGALEVFSRSGAVTVGSDARLIGGSGLSVEAATLLTVAEGAVLEGRQSQGEAATWPQVSLLAENGGVFISAADIDLRGSIVSRLGEGFGDLVLLMGGESATLGGDGSGGGFNLSNAEFQRISARNLVAGRETGDVTVQDLTLDSERLTDLWLGTGSEGRLTVAGDVNSTGPRRVNLRLGFVASTGSQEEEEGEGGPAGDSADGAPLPQGERYIPGEIVITGSLGGGGRLGRVSMIAENDIIMGSEAYLTAAEGDDDFDPGREPNLATPGLDHLFVQADGLQMAAGSRILQQNTGPAGSHTGVRIGRPGAEEPLIVRFDDLLGGSDSVSESTAGPRLVDLHLVIDGEGGQLITGRQAAEAAGLLEIGSGSETESALVINGCADVGAIACSGEDDVPVFQNPIELELAATQSAQSSEAVEGAIQTFLVVPTDESEDTTRDAIGLPVTGSGNEDLWPGSLQEVEP